jgi:hypothetical protein
VSSPPPPERPESSTPEEDIYEPEADELDTGPLRVPASPPSFDSDWDPAPAQGTWEGRFDAPLTVSPRPLHSPRRPNVRWGAVTLGAGVIVALVVVGLAFWLLRPSSDDPSPEAQPPTSASPTPPNAEDAARLLRLLPQGYPEDSCEAVAPPKNALAQVNCDKNSDPGGPLSATYTLARDKAALDATFNDALAAANRVNCPGNIQSPGPWRRNATPEKISGTLFCGLQEGRPTVAWTDDAKLVVSVVHAGPPGPTLPQLYEWWSSHS